MTRDRIESWAKLCKEYGFQTFYAVATICAIPWFACYVVLPITEDHRRFLAKMEDVSTEIVKVQQQQGAAINSIERFVAVHCMERRHVTFQGKNDEDDSVRRVPVQRP